MRGGSVIVVGGGAAGFFGAITCAEADPGRSVCVLEKSAEFLSKVRISGGGRCNVTHACFEPRELVTRYPRGRRELLGPFHRFQPRDTVAWFESRGIRLKTEADGRMFPVTDSSLTIVDSLLNAARGAGVETRANVDVVRVERLATGGFRVEMGGGGVLAAERVLLATGGCRAAAAGRIAESLGHTMEPPVPSLFTFTVDLPWLRGLAGVTVPDVEVSIPGTTLRERGPLLITHWGVSGPAVLRLSAWGARELHGRDYRFPLRVNWLGGRGAEAVAAEVQAKRQVQGGKRVTNSPLGGLPGRLWEGLVAAAGVGREQTWAMVSRATIQGLVARLTAGELPVTGKSLNKDEFVTCGGVRLSEVDFRTMESRVCPGLHLAGEVLDIDAVTGGFNFQAAWTTGWLAGRAMAGSGVVGP